MIVPSQLALKTHANFGCAASQATLDKLVDTTADSATYRQSNLTHVMRLAAHSTTSSMLTAMR
jgi:hypothetical protein